MNYTTIPEYVTQLAGLGGVPFVVFLTNRTKQAFPRWDASTWPAVAIFWGIVLNLALCYLVRGDYAVATVIGVVAGYLASERYEKGKEAKRKHSLMGS